MDGVESESGAGSTAPEGSFEVRARVRGWVRGVWAGEGEEDDARGTAIDASVWAGRAIETGIEVRDSRGAYSHGRVWNRKDKNSNPNVIARNVLQVRRFWHIDEIPMPDGVHYANEKGKEATEDAIKC